MSLAGHIALTAARLLQDRAETYAGQALRLAQWSAERGAERLEAAAPRIATLTEAGLRLTAITCRCMDRLVRQGLDSAQDTMIDGADRLRRTASARSLAAVYAAQREAFPATRRRMTHDLAATWDIVSSASREVLELARTTRGELLGTPTRRGRPKRAGAARPRPAGKRTSRSRKRGSSPTT